MRHTLTLGARVTTSRGPGVVCALHKAGWIRVRLDNIPTPVRLRAAALALVEIKRPTTSVSP